MNAAEIKVGDRVKLANVANAGEGAVTWLEHEVAFVAWDAVPGARVAYHLHELTLVNPPAAEEPPGELIEYDVDLEVCTDCAMLIANDEIEEIRRAEHVTAILERLGLPRILGWLVVNGDEPHFSTSPCDACGSPLAGDRLSAVAGSPVRAEQGDPMEGNPYDMDAAEIATTNGAAELEDNEGEAEPW